VIRNFKHKGLQRLYLKGEAKGVMSAHAKRLQVRLERLDISNSVDELPVEWKCHALSGEMKGHYAISLSAQWRLVFRFEDGEFCDVDYAQYH
jgi:proteic killer suppression protein